MRCEQSFSCHRISVVLAALACVITASSARSARADTVIPGGNVGGQTWTASGSPYVVQGDVTVQTGATLTIQQGVTVRFGTSDAAASGADSSRAELIVAGTLAVNGTSGSPVTFESSGTSTTSWYGIRFLAGSTATLTSFSLTEAYYGIRSEGGAPNVSNAVLFNCQEGAHVESGNLTASRVVFLANTTGVATASTAGTVTLDHCSVSFNTLTGLAFAGGTSTVDGCIVSQNPYGISRAAGSVTVTYSDVWGNTGWASSRARAAFRRTRST